MESWSVVATKGDVQEKTLLDNDAYARDDTIMYQVVNVGEEGPEDAIEIV